MDMTRFWKHLELGATVEACKGISLSELGHDNANRIIAFLSMQEPPDNVSKLSTGNGEILCFVSHMSCHGPHGHIEH